MIKKITVILLLLFTLGITSSSQRISQNPSNMPVINNVKEEEKAIPLKKVEIPKEKSATPDDEAKLRELMFGPRLQQIPKLLGSHPNSENNIAITFDDGPSYAYTAKYIEILKQYNAKATFFLTGENVEKNPGLVKLIADNGFEIGTHSYSHGDMAKMSQEEIKRELWRSSLLIHKITGQKVTLFRPPYGSVSDSLKIACQDFGLRIIYWNVDPRDWENPDYWTIANRIAKNAHSGSIILMHEGRKNTLKALPYILQYLHSKGYKLVTISELLSH
ncbi:polysaccharide deacetylase family protein [Caldanaerobius polysaccharolyticus]|uniref:polysaccharide deacetylase family protein n=1 Tax=Caldanaerobius polysaccharolyticus TaxID=44256 RepID=UPI0006898C4C|nr:polysaccharide deacetylase family protein [Caldanaerobius polysaccharolyticus]